MHENSVQLLGYYGSDLTHACSAWTSTSRELTEDKIQRIPGLLKMLATNRHGTPFEKSSLHFLVTTEIATHAQYLKHRSGVSLNGESARYKELKEDKFYTPPDWPEEWKTKLNNYTENGLELYHQCLKSLVKDYGFEKPRAKESARFFRGYNTQLDSDIMFNWRSFVHFLGLRNKPEAQLEIRKTAQQMLELVKNIEGNPFEHTISAFQL